MSSSLRLSEIISRDVAVEWFEAIAVVRAVAETLTLVEGEQGVPELDQVHLSPDGEISINGALKTDEPVRRLGQLLQACLVHSDPPVQLRLSVAQATAPEPGYSSVRECSDALGYFERPDRSRVLRGLFLRADAAPAGSAFTEPTLDAIAPLQPHVSEKSRKHAGARRGTASRRSVLAIVGAALFAVVATASFRFNGGASGSADLSAMAVKASDALGTKVVQGISAVTDRVGLGRLAPADLPSPAPSVPVAVAPTAMPSRPVVAKRAETASSLRIFDLANPPVQAPPPPEVDGANELPVAVPEPPPAADTTIVYSSKDVDVSAPIGIRPQLPRVLPENVATGQLSQIELLILPDGTVASAKLVGGRGGVLDGMLLSAAKTWTFKPAEKNGRPVTYRKTVWLVRE
jgi:hypothetical protein